MLWPASGIGQEAKAGEGNQVYPELAPRENGHLVEANQSGGVGSQKQHGEE
jgi:hypothetical protein